MFDLSPDIKEGSLKRGSGVQTRWKAEGLGYPTGSRFWNGWNPHPQGRFPGVSWVLMEIYL